ncbi:MAG TPA: hypothetical protein VJ372_24070 [Pyrinomonadaceae bacterium]|jgi:hypothetical protein|nr:hypothetical protein [Pyrinomonadaceae bacterium]
MKVNIANLTRLTVLGNADSLSEQETSLAGIKHWRQRLGYCSILASVPALLTSQMPTAQADGTKKSETTVVELGAKRAHRLKMSSTPELLKRQSSFRLPHQVSGFNMLAMQVGNDDCPGRPIPGGNYTSLVPFVDSGDTTGANDTVTLVQSPFYFYYSYNAHGPDHIYSFTLTGRGSSPKIEVSTSSGTYKPMIYILQGTSGGGCPAGTGKEVSNDLVVNDSRWITGNSTATLGTFEINSLPLNVPLHLFIDSAEKDASSSGPYTIRMQDVTIAPTAGSNSIDSAEFFVRQHYLDFLNREPDTEGLSFWTNEITSCGFDQQCTDVKRINVSAAYFLSIEFQQTGYLVYRLYKASYGNLPNMPVPLKFSEFLPDTQKIGQDVIVNHSGWEQTLENNKQAFLLEFVQRPRFTEAYPTSLTPDQFVDRLFSNAGITPLFNDWTNAANEFNSALTTNDVAARARVLRDVAENPLLTQQEFNRAFVLMQYFGYLRRNPNDAPEPSLNFDGYNFWLTKLVQFNGNSQNAEMVKAFTRSAEYRRRFGP